jgi:hypothetical protein
MTKHPGQTLQLLVDDIVGRLSRGNHVQAPISELREIVEEATRRTGQARRAVEEAAIAEFWFRLRHRIAGRDDISRSCLQSMHEQLESAFQDGAHAPN